MVKNIRRGCVQKKLVCHECSSTQTIWRRGGRNKREGHTKHLYCPTCKKETPHRELSRTF